MNAELDLRPLAISGDDVGDERESESHGVSGDLEADLPAPAFCSW